MIQTRSKSSIGCTTAGTSRIWSAVPFAICCSIGVPRTSTSARQLNRTKSRSSSATAGLSAGDSASPTSSSESKTIEVATFRRQVPAAEIDAEPTEEVEAPEANGNTREAISASGRPDRLIYRDNTYGTPEEDAFRRDFTVNALFYDIGTFSIIDYVGGLRDLEARVIRSIGEPDVRFLEDPVRMLRAVVLAARLEFAIDEPILESIELHKHEIARSAPARLVEEYYKILRSGHAQEAFKQLRSTGLLKAITPELATDHDALRRAVAALDRYRARFHDAPDTLTNAILAGTLLVPMGLVTRRQRFTADPLERRVELGLLPIARRDVERLHQMLSLQPKLLDIDAPHRAQRGVLHRSAFAESLTWLDIHGDRPDVVAHWRGMLEQARHPDAALTAPGGRARRSCRGSPLPPPAPPPQTPRISRVDVGLKPDATYVGMSVAGAGFRGRS